MPIELWGAFAVAAAIVLAIPGPTILLVVQTGLLQGRGALPWSVAGTVIGDAIAVSVSILGLGALLAASATAFTVAKILGAAYLIWLGVQAFRKPPPAIPSTDRRSAARRLPASAGWTVLRRTALVTTLNPKSIAFFVAFLPQFVSPAAPAGPQFALLAVTFLVLAGVNAALFGYGAGRLAPLLAGQRVRRWIGRIGGGCLIAAGLATAVARRG